MTQTESDPRPIATDPNPNESNPDRLFIVQAVGVLAGVVITVVLIITTTICLAIFCIPKVFHNRDKTSAKTQRKRKQSCKTDENIEMRKLQAHNVLYKLEQNEFESSYRSLGLNTGGSRRDNSNERQQKDEPVYTVVNLMYKKSTHAKQDPDSRYSYVNVWRS